MRFALHLAVGVAVLALAGCGVEPTDEDSAEDVAQSEDEVRSKSALAGNWRRMTKPLEGVHLQFRQDGTLGVGLMTGSSMAFTNGSYRISGDKLELQSPGSFSNMPLNGKWSFDVNASKRTLTIARDGAVYVFRR
jgi:hypothetical protein